VIWESSLRSSIALSPVKKQGDNEWDITIASEPLAYNQDDPELNSEVEQVSDIVIRSCCLCSYSVYAILHYEVTCSIDVGCDQDTWCTNSAALLPNGTCHVTSNYPYLSFHLR